MMPKTFKSTQSMFYELRRYVEFANHMFTLSEFKAELLHPIYTCVFSIAMHFLKLSCRIPFTHAFSTLGCIFEVLTLVHVWK